MLIRYPYFLFGGGARLNRVAAVVGWPSPQRELLDASPLISSLSNDSRLHLAMHRPLRGGGEGPGWLAWRSSAITATPVRAGVAGGPARGKEANGEGLICISADGSNRVVDLMVNHR